MMDRRVHPVYGLIPDGWQVKTVGQVTLKENGVQLMWLIFRY
ncbi:MAG: hypothetical protein P8Y03_25445 [Anaerolineales bacterium]|jgi:hypothetical protein